MDGRIVELHALTDADRARTEHDDLLAVAHQRLVLLLVGRVEIGHVGGELRRAGIDHLVDGENPQLLAQGVHLVLGSAPQHPDVLVAEAHALGLAQRRLVEGVRRHRALHLDDVLELLQEEHVDLGVVVDERQVDAVADQLGDGVEAVVGTLLDVGQHLVVRHRVELLVVDVAGSPPSCGPPTSPRPWLSSACRVCSTRRRTCRRGNAPPSSPRSRAQARTRRECWPAGSRRASAPWPPWP